MLHRCSETIVKDWLARVKQVGELNHLMLEDEARNIRDCVAMAQGGRGRGPAAEPPEPTEVPRTIGTWQACIKPGPCPCPNPCSWVAAQVRGRGGATGEPHLAKPPAQA